MKTSGDLPVRPLDAAVDDDRGAGKSAPTDGSPRWMPALLLGSLAVMAPWPLLAIAVMHSSFEGSSDAILMFGGITTIPLLLLVVVGVSETVFLVLLGLVWVTVAIVPGIWLARRRASRLFIGLMMGAQSAFSLAQAAVGALMIITRNV